MTDQLRVWAYNVGFGDAILVEVPDRHRGKVRLRHVLIDLGNVLAGPAGSDDVFAAVATDVNRRLGGKPVDLYVMTHEHLDHVAGLRAAAVAGEPIAVDYAWLTASAHRDYYRHHPESARRKRLALAEYDRILAAAGRLGLAEAAPVRAFAANNHPASTAACVDWLRDHATVATSYVHREAALVPGEHHPFREAQLDIWAPEEDTSRYYGRVPPVPGSRRRPRRPAGVDKDAYRALMDQLDAGLGASMLAIDRAANDTSVVFTLEWRGWRLLFPGDAESKSWQIMADSGVLAPVHFLKVGHHGSHNGTPPAGILEHVLPADRPDGRRRVALLSTWPDTYPGVPDQATLDRLEARVDVLRSTRTVPLGSAVEVTFPDPAPGR